MIETVLWMAGGALLTVGVLVFYAAYVGLMTSDEQYRRDFKHRTKDN